MEELAEVKKKSTGTLALMSVLTAAAMILSYVESQIPTLIPIPGVKLGLANLAVIMALYLLNVKSAVVISLLRVLLVSMLFGNVMSLSYSLAGAALSLTGMALLRKLPAFSTVSVSIAGGVLHNIGQIIVAALLTDKAIFIAYLPVLLVSGVAAGTLIGIIAGQVIIRLQRALKGIRS